MRGYFYIPDWEGTQIREIGPCPHSCGEMGPTSQGRVDTRERGAAGCVQWGRFAGLGPHMGRGMLVDVDHL